MSKYCKGFVEVQIFFSDDFANHSIAFEIRDFSLKNRQFLEKIYFFVAWVD